ncbi:MAG: hypothetical protein ABGX83_05400 [Nitrospira sp.]
MKSELEKDHPIKFLWKAWLGDSGVEMPDEAILCIDKMLDSAYQAGARSVIDELNSKIIFGDATLGTNHNATIREAQDIIGKLKRVAGGRPLWVETKKEVEE